MSQTITAPAIMASNTCALSDAGRTPLIQVSLIKNDFEHFFASAETRFAWILRVFLSESGLLRHRGRTVQRLPRTQGPAHRSPL